MPFPQLRTALGLTLRSVSRVSLDSSRMMVMQCGGWPRAHFRTLGMCRAYGAGFRRADTASAAKAGTYGASGNRLTYPLVRSSTF